MQKKYNKTQAIELMNALGKEQTPFVFLIDFEMQKIVIESDFCDASTIKFDINGVTNAKKIRQEMEASFTASPMSVEEYEKGFQQVKDHLQFGNSFLLNLTYPTHVKTDYSLDDIYNRTEAKYSIYLKGEFVCFSPEIFVQIDKGRIASYPMKGTIDASIPDAQHIILNDKKELAEHYTIVDLIRNDLSRVAKKVTVNRFRYIDTLQTDKKNLLQVSSEISGVLPDNYTEMIGDILFQLLPAGSISGAPKKKTLEIIREAEGMDRGYYTGICGYFDGERLDSGVMIRYIEQKEEEMYYRSGCGITSMSDMESEYHEMIDKVYLPMLDKSESSKNRKSACV